MTCLVLHKTNTGTYRLLHVLCCLWLPSDPGIFPSATIVLLGICYDTILSKHRNLPAHPSMTQLHKVCMHALTFRAGCCYANADIEQVKSIAPTALQSHCTAEMLIAPSKVPGRNGSPCPRSCKHRSPSTSLSLATSSIDSLISRPYSML